MQDISCGPDVKWCCAICSLSLMLLKGVVLPLYPYWANYSIKRRLLVNLLSIFLFKIIIMITVTVISCFFPFLVKDLYFFFSIQRWPLVLHPSVWSLWVVLVLPKITQLRSFIETAKLAQFMREHHIFSWTLLQNLLRKIM